MEASPQPMAPAMALALCANFGSVEQWQEQWTALGRALHNEDAGCVQLVFVPNEGALRNQWAPDPAPAVTNGTALLTQAPGASASIAWDQVYERYQHAVHASSERFAGSPEAAGMAMVLDVRRAGVFEQAPTMLPGAVWQDPALVAQWGAELPRGQEVLVYCVYGHEVGRTTAMRLCAMGVDAKYLPGGIDAWQAAGRAVQPRYTPLQNAPDGTVN